ncbi:MAG: hypothetical protein AAF146_06865 [Bacteroidota bacterium]
MKTQAPFAARTRLFRLGMLFSSLALLALSSCKNAYTAVGFEERTQDHRTVAVLPFEMVFLGQMPAQLSPEDILALEEAESKAFQVSFHNEIMRSAAGRRKIRVDLQPYTRTWALLAENDLSIRDSWRMKPEALAQLLGVDAVVRARIEKTQYFSDLTSFGIEAGLRVIDLFAGVRPIPSSFANSKEIYASYNLVSNNGREVLWSIACDIDGDWRTRSNEVIDQVNRRSARRFPYRL